MSIVHWPRVGSLALGLAVAAGWWAVGCSRTGGPAASPGGPAAAASETEWSYEAESPENEFGPNVTTDDPDVGGKCSGGAYVGYLGSGPQEFVRFRSIVVPRAGRYRLIIYYMSGEDRDMYVKVNDGPTRTFTFPSTGAFSSENMDTFELEIELRQGRNTIELGNPTAYAPDVDRIVIRPID